MKIYENNLYSIMRGAMWVCIALAAIYIIVMECMDLGYVDPPEIKDLAVLIYCNTALILAIFAAMLLKETNSLKKDLEDSQDHDEIIDFT